ncbi:DUF6263 family protein [Flavobacteriaceae bacterium KMM 6897]|nr:DUF6263 family protein [Flavobacteriaceae bacterium KMM 6897]MEB8347569.1 DUF6263 family protein [Flavobacteriaceae bacterium KMM 6898]
MRHFLAFLLFTFSITTIIGQSTLQYTLKVGDVFLVKQNAQQTIIQELDGSTHEIINQMYGILEFKVVGIKEKNYIISLTFKDLNLRMTSSIQGELMNVRAKEVVPGDTQSSIFHSILNSPVKMTLSRNGDILEVKGGDALVTKMTEASGLEDEFSIKMMKRSLAKEFGSDALSNSYKQMTFIYPTKKIKVGDTWQNEYSGKLAATTVWTLKGLTPKTAIITGKAIISMNVVEPASTMQLTGTQNTMITTDRNTGFISKMNVEGQSKGASVMAQMSDQKIPTTIKSKVTYELIKE